MSDAQQFARRLLVNILLANGDAHLKNWSLLYADKVKCNCESTGKGCMLIFGWIKPDGEMAVVVSIKVIA